MANMNALMESASQIRTEYKPAPGHDKNDLGRGYIFGPGVRFQLGEASVQLLTSGGRMMGTVMLVYDPCAPHVKAPDSDQSILEFARKRLIDAGLEIVAEIEGADPNSPITHGFEVYGALKGAKPDAIVAVCGTSGLDSVSYSNALYLAHRAVLKDDPNRFWGAGKGKEAKGAITELMEETGYTLLPVVKAQLLSGATGHLTKYSNNTDNVRKPGVKSLIIDPANRADLAIFDPEFTLSAPMRTRLDGAYDSGAHLFEPLLHTDPSGSEKYAKVQRVNNIGAAVLLNSVMPMTKNSSDLEIATQIATASDMGGIMIDQLQGTGLPHLASFLFVDDLSHGAACAITLPSYVAAFATRSPEAVRSIGKLYQEAGIGRDIDLTNLWGRDLGLAVGNMMIELARSTGYSASLSEVDVRGKPFSQENLQALIEAAGLPKYASKLVGIGIKTVDEAGNPIPEGQKEARETVGAWITAAFTGKLRDVPQFKPR